MRMLVLGGSGFVGRTVALEGVARGCSVTCFNRGRREPADRRVRCLEGDRLGSLEALRGDERWEVVVDTWSGDPRAVRESARLLADRVERYVYVSSCSVYEAPPVPGMDESSPVVRAGGEDYASLKRGGELAVLEAFGAERALLARAGLILGPFEDVGRLPWWLSRVARGGPVLAPGPPELPLQLIDARDLAAFLLEAEAAGPVNVISRPGHATMRSLLEACVAAAGASDARLAWVEADRVLAAGIEPWQELPAWIPPGHEWASMHGFEVARAHAAGLRCRPVEETVADTWAWMCSLDGPPPVREDIPPVGLDPERELAVLRAAASSTFQSGAPPGTGSP